MDTGFLLPIRALERGKLLTVRLSQFGDDPQQVLEAQAGFGSSNPNGFLWATSLNKDVDLSLPYFLFTDSITNRPVFEPSHTPLATLQPASQTTPRFPPSPNHPRQHHIRLPRRLTQPIPRRRKPPRHHIRHQSLSPWVIMQIRHLRLPKPRRPNRHRMLTLLPKLPRSIRTLSLPNRLSKCGWHPLFTNISQHTPCVLTHIPQSASNTIRCTCVGIITNALMRKCLC